MKRIGRTPLLTATGGQTLGEAEPGDVIMARIPPIRYFFKPWTWFRRSGKLTLGIICPAGHFHDMRDPLQPPSFPLPDGLTEMQEEEAEGKQQLH